MSTDTVSAGPSPAETPSRPRADTPRRWGVWLALLVSSAAMVYGTWLAADDMRAKPLVAEVTLDAAALTVVNGNDFTWRTADFTLDGAFRAQAPGPLEPGATLRVPLAAFVDESGRPVTAAGQPPRDLTATATRRSRFGAVNKDRTSSGRWLLP
jgi:hypothetical protein